MKWLIAAVCLLLVVTTAHGQDDGEVTDKFCNVMTSKIRELRQTTKSLCGDNSTDPWILDTKTMRNLAAWTSVTFTRIAYTNFRSVGTLSYEIPSIIPDEAVEVLIYAEVYAYQSSGSTSRLKIYTEGEDGEEYAKYITLIPWNSGANFYTNTDNLWFPMPTNRRVYFYVPYALSSSTYGYLYVIGYR